MGEGPGEANQCPQGPNTLPGPTGILGSCFGSSVLLGLRRGSSSSLGTRQLHSKVPFLQSPVGVCLLQHVNVAQGCTSENDLLTFLTLPCFGSCPGAVLESSGLGEQQLDSFQMKPNQMCSRNAPHTPQALLGVQATASAQTFSGV